jgi:hypothetical protein
MVRFAGAPACAPRASSSRGRDHLGRSRGDADRRYSHRREANRPPDRWRGLRVVSSEHPDRRCGSDLRAQRFPDRRRGDVVAGCDHADRRRRERRDTHSGFQLAPLNIARRNDGVQLGVINIGGGPDGDSFGLINIVPGGRTDLEASFDSDRIGTLMLRHSGRHWHNVYGFGGQHVDAIDGAPNNDVWMYGLGFGPSFHVANLPVDLDVIAWEVNHGDHHEDHVSLLHQLRLTVGVPVGPVTLVAGRALNAYVSSDSSSPFITARTTMPIDPMDTTVTVKLWPSLFVGART